MSEIDEKLKNAAEAVDVPDMLSPDVMRLRLDARERRAEKEAGRKADLVSEGGRTAKISGNDEADAAGLAAEFSAKAKAARERKKRQRRMFTTAAAAVLLVSVSSFLTYEHFEKQLEKAGTSLEEVASNNASAAASDGTPTEEETFVRHDAGDMYTVAKTDRAYQSYVKTQLKGRTSLLNRMKDSAVTEGATDDVAAAESASQSSEAESSDSAMTNGAGGGDYSETNTVVEGVDEADIVKTDGKYIYRLTGESVKVTKADGTVLTRCDDINITNDTIAAVRAASGADSTAADTKDGNTEESGSKEGTAGVFVPKEVADCIETCAVNVSEMFVKDDTLIVLGNLYKYGGGTGSDAAEDIIYKNGNGDSDTKLLGIFTYDISDPEAAKLVSVNCIDGYYQSARITSEDILVIFANNWIEDEKTAWPAVDGQKLSAEDIYLPRSGAGQTIIATYDMGTSGLSRIDSCMIVNDYCEQYVTDDAIYLYGSSYTSGVDATNVARFTLTGGKVDAAGAATVSGTVTDDFALRTVGDNLFILTTTYGNSGDTSNGLYVYDSAMKRRGALTGLAPGEQIYSARYIGNISYFVTYRQTDPLFAVDISNPDEPKLLGYLKITGFSDYLHPYGNGRLVGIGQETDPESGEPKGVKLTMFDISDPANPTELGSTVIPLVYSDLYTYDYRSVLASAEKNLIGFGYAGTESGDSEWNDWKYRYAFYSWNEAAKSFDVKYQIEEPAQGIAYQDARGLYIGDTLYVSAPSGIYVQGGEKLLY